MSEPPSDPGRAGVLAALVAGELAHRIFLDEADVRITEFTGQLHQQTGADPDLLDAVLRGLLGGSLPAATDPLTPLLVLGRGLVLELELNDQEVAELVESSDQQLPDQLPITAAPPNPRTPTAAVPAVPPKTVQQAAAQPPSAAVTAAPPDTARPSPAAPRPAKALYLVSGMLAACGVLALIAGLLPLPLPGHGRPPSVTSAPPDSDPSHVAQAFADAINNKQLDRALVLVCSGSSSMTRHIAQGQLPVQGFTVNRVDTQNSTTAYVLAKATITPQPKPLAWRGTLHNRGGKWCLLDLHPEDNSPPAQPETQSVAFEKMRSFITLVNQSDSVKAMTYVCGTRQRPFTQTIIDMAVTTGARLTVRPDPGREGASTYNGSVTGRSPKLRQEIVGDVEISRGNNGTYCISNFQIRYE